MGFNENVLALLRSLKAIYGEFLGITFFSVFSSGCKLIMLLGSELISGIEWKDGSEYLY